MGYKVMTAAAALLFLAGCDDPKPSADSSRDVGTASEMPGSSTQQGTVAKETPQNTMMMQSGAANGNAQTMQAAPENQPRPGPDGEPLAGTQPLKPATAPRPTSPVPGQN